MTLESFEGDARTQDAVTRRLEIIGEAVKAFREIGLSPGFADALIELIRGDEAAREQALDRLLLAPAGRDRREADILVAVTARLIRDEAFQDLRKGPRGQAGRR